jgi:hypothetical protein
MVAVGAPMGHEWGANGVGRTRRVHESHGRKWIALHCVHATLTPQYCARLGIRCVALLSDDDLAAPWLCASQGNGRIGVSAKLFAQSGGPLEQRKQLVKGNLRGISNQSANLLRNLADRLSSSFLRGNEATLGRMSNF